MLRYIYNQDLTVLQRTEIVDLLESVMSLPTDNTYVLNLLINKFARINGVWTAEEKEKIKAYCNKYQRTASGFPNPEANYIMNTITSTSTSLY